MADQNNNYQTYENISYNNQRSNNPNRMGSMPHGTNQMSPPQNLHQSRVGIDPFNKSVIEKVIKELKDDQAFTQLLGGINDFGGSLGGDGLGSSEMNFNNVEQMNEESIDKWLKVFQEEWERNFQETCTEAKNKCIQKKMQFQNNQNLNQQNANNHPQQQMYGQQPMPPFGGRQQQNGPPQQPGPGGPPMGMRQPPISGPLTGNGQPPHLMRPGMYQPPGQPPFNSSGPPPSGMHHMYAQGPPGQHPIPNHPGNYPMPQQYRPNPNGPPGQNFSNQGPINQNNQNSTKIEGQVKTEGSLPPLTKQPQDSESGQQYSPRNMVGQKRQFNAPDQKDEHEDPNLKKQKTESKTQGEIFDGDNFDDEFVDNDKKTPVKNEAPVAKTEPVPVVKTQEQEADGNESEDSLDFGDDDAAPNTTQVKQDVLKTETPGATTTAAPVTEGENHNDPPADDDSDINPSDPNESDKNSASSNEDETNVNMIIAQYKTENRVRSTFKFSLQNVVMFIEGQHYYVKELKATITF